MRAELGWGTEEFPIQFCSQGKIGIGMGIGPYGCCLLIGLRGYGLGIGGGCGRSWRTGSGMGGRALGGSFPFVVVKFLVKN
jgi:hypothetical protein